MHTSVVPLPLPGGPSSVDALLLTLSRANRADSIALQLDFLNKAPITGKDLSRVFSFVTVENAYVCASWIGLDICTDTTRRTFSLNHDKRFLLHTLGDYPQRHRVSPSSSP